MELFSTDSRRFQHIKRLNISQFRRFCFIVGAFTFLTPCKYQNIGVFTVFMRCILLCFVIHWSLPTSSKPPKISGYSLIAFLDYSQALLYACYCSQVPNHLEIIPTLQGFFSSIMRTVNNAFLFQYRNKRDYSSPLYSVYVRFTFSPPLAVRCVCFRVFVSVAWPWLYHTAVKPKCQQFFVIIY